MLKIFNIISHQRNPSPLYNLAFPILYIYPRKAKTCPHKKLVHNCYSNFILKSQKLETTQILSRDEWRNKLWIYSYNRILYCYIWVIYIYCCIWVTYSCNKILSVIKKKKEVPSNLELFQKYGEWKTSDMKKCNSLYEILENGD